MSTRPDSIDVEVASEYLAEKKAILVDSRSEQAVNRSGVKLPGAIHIPPGHGAAIDQALSSLPRELLLVCYGDGDAPDDATAAVLARRARELGVGDASVLEGGVRAWQAAALPVEAVRVRHIEGELASLSLESLRKLCVISWALGIVSNGIHEWDDSREGLRRYALMIPISVVDRFKCFLEVESSISVPDDHPTRMANIPVEVRARARLMTEEVSELILRWLTWTQLIPRHQAWWYTPPDEVSPKF
jgi:rhodanese-related sulfurtransferase